MNTKIIAAVAVLVLGLAGGLSFFLSNPGQAEMPTTDTEPAAKPFEPPKEEGGVGATEIVVKNPLSGSSRREYEQDVKCPSGALRGVVKYLGAPSQPKEAKLLEFTGPNEIPNPKNGELDYYKKMKIKEMLDFGAVIRILGIKQGRLAPLNPDTLFVSRGRIGGLGSGTGGGGVGGGLSDREAAVVLSPVYEREHFAGNELFPSQLVMTRSGSSTELMNGTLPAYEDPNQPGATWTGSRIPTGPNANVPQMIPKIDLQSPPLGDMGCYKVTSPRHPWKIAYVYVVDSPYAVVVHGRNKPIFNIEQVPVGRHVVEVWHPQFEPVQKTYEIDIKQDETIEIAVELKVPPGEAAQPEVPKESMKDDKKKK